MQTKQSQIKINLPLKLKDKMKRKAAGYGLNLASYIKVLMVKDIKESEYSVFEPSESTKRAYKLAKKEESEGKLKEVRSIVELKNFFEELK